jgi:transcriptional regulator with PAS, ATPase and Fis domain
MTDPEKASGIALRIAPFNSESQSETCREKGESVSRFGALVGTSEVMRTLFGILRRTAASEATVLLQGETGTGKEASAEAIHREGHRKDGPFIIVDCGALPRHLLESELFGSESGAFTGALDGRPGAFQAASGGTILLDEIGELSLDLQSKILRAIETRSIRRIGSTTYLPVDVRILAATTRSLRGEVAAKRFQSDLYYRLAVLKVTLPPLRARTADIPSLVEDILDRLGMRDTSASSAFLAPAFVAKLTGYDWPGNVRELRNYIERCIALCDTNISLFETMAPPGCVKGRSSPKASSEQEPTVDGSELSFEEARGAVVVAFERQYLKLQLSRHANNITAAARASRIRRHEFYRLLRKHGLRGRGEENIE